MSTNLNSASPPDVLILAAGLGTRMRSDTAKVLHNLAGRPLITYVYRAALALNPKRIAVIVGHQAEAVESAVRGEHRGDSTIFIKQKAQRGTGDAVLSAADAFAESRSTLLVLSGDVPLIDPSTLTQLFEAHTKSRASATMLTVTLNDPTGYGRIIRDDEGEFLRIVEQNDASPEEKALKEINAGIYCFDTSVLFPALRKVRPANAQGEYYLTDVPGILRADGQPIGIFLHNDSAEVSGINTRVEQATFEKILRDRTAKRLMLENGVTFIDPSATYVGPDVTVGKDTIIYPGVQLEGTTVVGDRCVIRAGSRIQNSTISNNVTIKDHCVIVDSKVSEGCTVGPFAHLRMGTVLEDNSAVGNFVEMKKSKLGRKSKAMHLAYLGDATIGKGTNIGAGTITANYDGKNKHPTVIKDRVKIGSNTVLVAPVTINEDVVTGAGAVVTVDVPARTLVAGVPATVKKQLDANE